MPKIQLFKAVHWNIHKILLLLLYTGSYYCYTHEIFYYEFSYKIKNLNAEVCFEDPAIFTEVLCFFALSLTVLKTNKNVKY